MNQSPAVDSPPTATPDLDPAWLGAIGQGIRRRERESVVHQCATDDVWTCSTSCPTQARRWFRVWGEPAGVSSDGCTAEWRTDLIAFRRPRKPTSPEVQRKKVEALKLARAARN